MRASLPIVPRGRVQVDMPIADARRLLRAERKVREAEAGARALLAELVGIYGAGAAGRVLGITKQAVQSRLRTSIPEQDIPTVRQASKEADEDDSG